MEITEEMIQEALAVGRRLNQGGPYRRGDVERDAFWVVEVLSTAVQGASPAAQEAMAKFFVEAIGEPKP